jgi:hypothetical protein
MSKDELEREELRKASGGTHVRITTSADGQQMNVLTPSYPGDRVDLNPGPTGYGTQTFVSKRNNETGQYQWVITDRRGIPIENAAPLEEITVNITTPFECTKFYDQRY